MTEMGFSGLFRENGAGCFIKDNILYECGEFWQLSHRRFILDISTR